MPSFTSSKRSYYDRNNMAVLGSSMMLVTIMEEAHDNEVVNSSLLRSTARLSSRSSWGNQSIRTGLSDLATATTATTATTPTMNMASPTSSIQRRDSNGLSNGPSQPLASANNFWGYFVDE